MFTLSFKTAAAFDDAVPEIERILQELINRVGAGETAGAVRDVNGDSIGGFQLTEN